MQRDKIQKPKVRFTRNADGSIGIPRDNKTDELVELWGKQSASLEIPRLSIKQEISKLKQAYTKKLSKKHIQKKQTIVLPTVKKLETNKSEQVSKNQTNTETRPITITVSIPAFRVPKKISAIPKKPILIGLAVVMVVVVGFALLNQTDNDTNRADSNGQVQGAVDSGISTNVKPSFPVLTPNGKGVDDLGGFAKINPPGKPDVYVFTDNLSGTPIKVSQQKAPEDLLTDPTKVSEIAKQFNATKTFDAGEFTVYNGISIKGPQSLVYTKGDLLVLIVADKELPSATWVDYISNLRF
jgi:hypothetical protein